MRTSRRPCSAPRRQMLTIVPPAVGVVQGAGARRAPHDRRRPLRRCPRPPSPEDCQLHGGRAPGCAVARAHARAGTDRSGRPRRNPDDSASEMARADLGCPWGPTPIGSRRPRVPPVQGARSYRTARRWGPLGGHSEVLTEVFVLLAAPVSCKALGGVLMPCPLTPSRNLTNGGGRLLRAHSATVKSAWTVLNLRRLRTPWPKTPPHTTI